MRIELRCVHATDADNGKVVRVPANYRLSVLLRGKWYNRVTVTQHPPGVRMLGVPEHQDVWV